jgi:3-oxoadipate enol-lactonase
MGNFVIGHIKASDGCDLGYTLHGAPRPDAPRVALVHSLALDRTIWDGVVAALADDAEVLAFDCRGHGSSGRPHMTYTPELFARDLAELMDHLHWPDAVVAGCSMGGMVVQAFAAKYPQRTKGVALIDTTAWYGADAPKTWRERAATARAKGMGALIAFQETRWFGDAFRAEQPSVVQALKDVFLASDVGCYEKTCEMLGDSDMRPLLASIKAPAAVAVGDEDYATPVNMAEALHKALPGSTLTVIAGGRHITPAERPREITDCIRGLLAACRT